MNPSAILGLAKFGRMVLPIKVMGLFMICFGLWFALGMMGRPPFTTIWLRASVIGVVVVIGAIIALIGWNRRRRAAAAIERDLVGPQATGDAAVLSERMVAALDTLRKAGGKTYLYDLPWYIIIGPPGAGKTTALRNSGLEFPGSRLDAVEGLSGTRNCDWWFTEEAVLIDTAGRYTTQDSDAASDASSWTAFLQLLKRNRPRQPINGVILTFSCEDLMGAQAEELAKHAATVRQRLSEIHEHLKIDFPVYLVFSKADLIAGFREYFAMLTPQRRKAVWGVTFQTRDRQEPTWQQAEKEFGTLIAKLSDGVSDRLAEEIDGPARLAIFGFPGQMALLKGNLAEFLRQVFAPTRYGTTAILRGFYFASGTQEGTPIDQVLGAMSRDANDESAFRSVQLSGKGKAFFLEDLLSKVIFAERDWVGFDVAAARRGAVLRTATLVGIGLLSLGLGGLLAAIYWSNDQFLRGASTMAQTYKVTAQPELERQVIGDPDPQAIVPHLASLRSLTDGCGHWSAEATPAAGTGTEAEGAAVAGDGLPISLPMLDQRQAIQDVACTAYRDGLERMLRPRMILRVENDLERLIHDGNVGELYQALKVYLLLGRVQEGSGDDEALRSYFRGAWAEDLPGVASADTRDALEAHLAAMLALDDELSIKPSLVQELIDKARQEIVNLPVAEQAYAVILDRASSRDVTFLSLPDLAGGEAGLVFQVEDGTPIENLGVPAIYSFDGYWGHFIPEIGAIEERLAADKWVLGESASAEVDYEGQLAQLEGALQQIYRQRFTEAWTELLADLSVRPVAAEDGLDVLHASSSQASPILQLARSVERHTRVDRLFEEALAAAEAAEPGAFEADALPEAVGGEEIRALYNGSAAVRGILQDFVADAAKDGGRIGSGSGGSPQEAAERLSDVFENWHVLHRGEPGEQPMDLIRDFLRGVYDVRYQSAMNPAATDRQMLQTALASLTANNSSLPEPLARWLNEVASDLRAENMDSTIGELNRALNDSITVFCQQRIDGRFPLGDGDVMSLDDFGEFFGPNGLMDRFYAERLASLVTQTTEGLKPVPGDPLAERLSPAALEQFRRAQEIRAEFFSAGSAAPQVSMDISRAATSAGVDTAILTIGEETAVSQPGDTFAKSFNWPDTGAGVSIEVYPQAEGRENVSTFGGGRWAIASFLRGEPRIEGNQADVTHVVGGRSVTYRVVFPNSQTVPFLMDELDEFSCPTSLE